MNMYPTSASSKWIYNRAEHPRMGQMAQFDFCFVCSSWDQSYTLPPTPSHLTAYHIWGNPAPTATDYPKGLESLIFIIPVLSLLSAASILDLSPHFELHNVCPLFDGSVISNAHSLILIRAPLKDSKWHICAFLPYHRSLKGNATVALKFSPSWLKALNLTIPNQASMRQGGGGVDFVDFWEIGDNRSGNRTRPNISNRKLNIFQKKIWNFRKLSKFLPALCDLPRSRLEQKKYQWHLFTSFSEIDLAFNGSPEGVGLEMPKGCPFSFPSLCFKRSHSFVFTPSYWSQVVSFIEIWRLWVRSDKKKGDKYRRSTKRRLTWFTVFIGHS